MSPEDKLRKTAHILTLGKALAPDRFPKPSQEACSAWAAALDRLFDNMPTENFWEETVRTWALDLVGDKMITPKELKHAAYVTRDRWESDPRKRPILNAARKRAEEIRDRQLADGTFGALRGHTAPQITPHKQPDRKPSEIFHDITNQIGEMP